MAPPHQPPKPPPLRRRPGFAPGGRLNNGLVPYMAAGLLLLGLHHSRLLQKANLLLYDQSQRLRPLPDGSSTPVRLITITEADLKEVGWPIDDGMILAAIQRLDQAGVRAIGLDLYRDIGVGPDQPRLRALVRRQPRVVSVFSSVDGIGAIPGTPPQRQAYNDLVIDPDQRVRRDLLFVRGMGAAMVPLPLRMLELGHRGRALREALEHNPAFAKPLQESSGGYHGLDNGGVQRLLAYHRPGSFPSWSLRALLGGKVPVASLRDCLVLIGSEAPSLRDRFRVPFPGRSSGEALLMPGVEIHAHRLAALIALQEGRPLGMGAAPAWVNKAGLVAAILVGIGLGEGVRKLRHSQTLVLGLVAAMLLASAALLWQGWWFDAASPLAALIALASAAWSRRAPEQQQQRQDMQGLLQQTTSHQVAGELWRQRGQLLEGGRFAGRQVEITVLFTDIAGFTRVSEQLNPAALMAWLNRGMEAMVDPVQAEGGVVNKFTGDGLMAIFGAPLGRGPRVEALAAMRAAANIRQAMQVLNRQLLAEGLPAMKLRIGVHTGPVLAGSVGTPERWEFSVIGDTVNCASRIEGLDRSPLDSSPCRVLLSEATLALLDQGIQGAWRHRGALELRGRSAMVEIWELLEDADGVDQRAAVELPSLPHQSGN